MKILVLINNDLGLYRFRMELIETLVKKHKVYVSVPNGEFIKDIENLGCNIIINKKINSRGKNPFQDLKLFYHYKYIIKKIKPSVILGYTIKPNIYGAMAAKRAGVPFVANITGLGSAVENGGWKQKIIVMLYKMAFTKVQRIFFQNEENREFFRRKGIAIDKYKLLPGSGVNLERYPVSPLLECGNGKIGAPVRFAFISRIMKEKGIDQYLAAAEILKKKYPSTEFHVCGYCEAEYNGRLEEMNKAGIVIYHGMIRDVSNFISDIHCIVHPTYYPEGLSNILLESCSSGRAIITTARSGCREVVIDGVNGYVVSEKNVKELVLAIERYIKLSQNEKIAMGLEGRKLVEENFDRQIVVDRYMEEIYIAEEIYRKEKRKGMGRENVKLKNS